MNRRDFIRKTAAALIGTTLALNFSSIEDILIEKFSDISDVEFQSEIELYLTNYFQIYVSNPSASSIIVNIEEIEDD